MCAQRGLCFTLDMMGMLCTDAQIGFVCETLHLQFSVALEDECQEGLSIVTYKRLSE